MDHLVLCGRHGDCGETRRSTCARPATSDQSMTTLLWRAITVTRQSHPRVLDVGDVAHECGCWEGRGDVPVPVVHDGSACWPSRDAVLTPWARAWLSRK
jgi:hypothetical protein